MISHGTLEIVSWLLKHNTAKKCMGSRWRLGFPSTSSMISLECHNCGHKMIVNTDSPGATIEMLAEISRSPNVYLELWYDKVGAGTKPEPLVKL